MKSSKSTGHLNIGVVILSSDYRVIGINKYASEVLQLDFSYIGKSVYKYHPSKTHSRIKHLLNKARSAIDDIPAPVIMNVLDKTLAVDLCRIELKESPLRSFFIMAFMDVTDCAAAGITQDSKTIKLKKIPVYNSGAYLFLNISSLYLIKSEGNYCRVFTDSEQYYLRVALKEIEKKYIGEKFFRVHRSYLVNLDNVHRIIQNARGQTIIDFNKKYIPLAPVARRKVNDLKKTLRLIKGHVK